MNLLGLGSSATIVFKLNTKQGRPKKLIRNVAGKAPRELCIYQGNEPITGEVVIIPKKRKIEHIGIKIELVGQIEQFFERTKGNSFISQVKELEAPGILDATETFNFSFENMDKPYESYIGLNAQVRYYLKVTISSHYGMNTVAKEEDIWIQNLGEAPPVNSSIKMEVGIEQCLHIEFEYDKSRYHLNDVVIGKVYFLLVRIKIKSMELAIIKRESCGAGTNVTNESETLVKFEIMDGAPVKGESVPVRLFLSRNPKLTPTYSNVYSLLSVKYYLNLVLLDETDRRYFKQQEITLWRKEIK